MAKVYLGTDLTDHKQAVIFEFADSFYVANNDDDKSSEEIAKWFKDKSASIPLHLLGSIRRHWPKRDRDELELGTLCVELNFVDEVLWDAD